MILPGVIASSGGVASSYESIATTTLTTSTASVTFSSIPSTFTHLQVRGMLRTVSASTGGMWGKVYMNSDTTTSNYATHNIYGQGTGSALVVGGLTGTSLSQYCFYTAHAGDNSWGDLVMDVLDYKNTNKYKTSRFLSGYDANGSGLIMFSSELWMNTAAITSITIDNTGANFAQYSSFALYGVKG